MKAAFLKWSLVSIRISQNQSRMKYVDCLEDGDFIFSNQTETRDCLLFFLSDRTFSGKCRHAWAVESSSLKGHAGLPMLEGTNPASCFPRTVIGYEATCYSRIWSEVFVADICATNRDDIYNQNDGMQFRNNVLCAGGTKDPLEMLTDFL